MKNKIMTIVLLLGATITTYAQTPVRLSLDECLEAGGENASMVRNSILDLEYAKAQKSEAFTYYFPTVNASALGFHLSKPLVTIDAGDLLGGSDMANNLLWQFETFAQMNGMNTSYSFIRNGFSAGLSLIQPVYAGGKIVNSNRLALLGVQAAELKQSTASRDNNLEIEQKYWT
ncbi:MAG: TolC family protein, partial [Bacteroidales bacterium]|nr:TolC family protein [Bacteroidales bacterium]